MQIQHMKAFVLLCQEKNISQCSQQLHISQQGLSRQIKAMEQEFGTTLFVRTNKGVELTKECELILPFIEKALSNYEKALDELNDYQRNHQETLRVSVCPGIKQQFGLDIFKEFQRSNPGIRLKLEFHSDIECEEALYNNKVDAAFLDWPEHETEYENYLVVKSPLVAVMRKDHSLSDRDQISMHDLAGMNVYIPDESHRMSQRFLKYWPDIYHSVVIDFTTNEYESFYRDLPKRGGGVALTFRFLCNDLDPDLVAVPIIEKSFVELYYCIRRDHIKSNALDRFTDLVHESMRPLSDVET